MMIKNVVKVLVDVIQHVYHFHRCAVFTYGCETHDVTEVDGDFFKQFWLYTSSLLQRFYHRPVGVGERGGGKAY